MPEPDARMVEIGVYSTVGTSWYELPKFRGDFGVKCGKVVVEKCGTAEERAETGVKDVVKMVEWWRFAHCKKFPRTAAAKFGTMRAYGLKD